MGVKLVGYGIQYACFLLEGGLIVYLLRRSYWKRLATILVYAACFLAAGALRALFLYRFGLASPQYGYWYWMTDVLLVLAAFLLVCSFFRRACVQEEKMWRFIRLLLVFVFLLVLGISTFSLWRNLDHLFTRFIIEFQQNLYFTCLVLNTLLYLLMQQLDSADDELGLLVCGMGIQLAGPAATLALVHLTPGQHSPEWLLKFISPLAALGMLLTWFYAVSRAPVVAAAHEGEGKFPAAGEAAASKA